MARRIIRPYVVISRMGKKRRFGNVKSAVRFTRKKGWKKALILRQIRR